MSTTAYAPKGLSDYAQRVRSFATSLRTNNGVDINQLVTTMNALAKAIEDIDNALSGQNGIVSVINSNQNNTQFSSITIGNANGDSPLTVSATGTTQAPQAGTIIHAAQADNTDCDILLDAFKGTVNVIGRRADGGIAGLSAVQNNEQIIGLSAEGYGATTYPVSPSGLAAFVASENFTDAHQGTEFAVTVTKNGSLTQVVGFRVRNDATISPATCTVGTAPAPPDGAMIFCSDAKNLADDGHAVGQGLVSGGHGAFIGRANGQWRTLN